MDLIIVRHARPVRQELGADEGFADPELSEVGREQANRVSDYLLGEQIDHIVASSMRRAWETAAPLADALGLEVELSDDLRESDLKSSTYVPSEEMTEDSPMIQAAMKDPLSIFDEGYEVFRDRVIQGFDRVIEENKGRTVAVFCHGMVTAIYLQVILDLPNPFAAPRPDYTGISRVLASSSGRRTLISANESAHVRDLLEASQFR